MSKRAVVVVDLQNEYLPSGKLPLVGFDSALENAAKVIDDTRSKGDLIVRRPIRARKGHRQPAGWAMAGAVAVLMASLVYFTNGRSGHAMPDAHEQHAASGAAARSPGPAKAWR